MPPNVGVRGHRALCAEPLSQHHERGTPPSGGPLKRDVLGEAVARQMPLWKSVPGPVFDRHARLLSSGLEKNLDLRTLFGREARLPPGKDETLAGLPHGYPTDLESLAIRKAGDEATTHARLEPQFTVALWSDPKERVGLPPGRDSTGKGIESAARIHGHAQRHEDFGRHFLFFCRCALSAESCRAHSASVSVSHALSSAIDSDANR